MIIHTAGLLAGNRNTDGSFNNLSSNGNFWSSLESGGSAWNRNLNSGNTQVNRNTNDKANGFSVRCLKNWRFYTNFMKNEGLLRDIFQAYYDARRNKRNTMSALAFEVDYESNLFQLYEEIITGTYTIGQSVCFISFKPVKREVFAANFRDRIIHHLIYNAINPFCERIFIHDSYSCRKGKGTSYGIRRVDHFIRSCSENYKKKCFILKLDISGYFMTIDRTILYEKVAKILEKFRGESHFDVNLILLLCQQVIFHDPTKNCRINGEKSDWHGLPKTKSLFWAGTNKGMPIGNLTSQLFGNIYLNDFDHFVQRELGCTYYGRYVDDIVIINDEKVFLLSRIPLLKNYLKEHLLIDLHPKKMYLQPFARGVLFLGAVIKPYRMYISNRVKGNFYNTLRLWRGKKAFEKIVASVNAYLGMMINYKTYHLRRKMMQRYFLPYFSSDFAISPEYEKIIQLKKRV